MWDPTAGSIVDPVKRPMTLTNTVGTSLNVHKWTHFTKVKKTTAKCTKLTTHKDLISGFKRILI